MPTNPLRHRRMARISVAAVCAATAAATLSPRCRANAFGNSTVVVSRTWFDGADPNNPDVQAIALQDRQTPGNFFGDVLNDPNVPGVNSPVVLDGYAVTNAESNAATASFQTGLSLPAPESTDAGPGLTTSFSSKSEGALTLSTDGNYLTFIGYQAPTGAIGVSNSFTPNAYPSPLPSGATTPIAYNRVVERIDAGGNTIDGAVLNNAFSGDNGRAVASVNGQQFYMVGNADKTEEATAGAQYSPLGATAAVQLGSQNNPPDKFDNYRAVTIFNNTLYVAKGSGGKGIDGVFQVGTAGTLPTTAGTPGTGITALPGLTFTAKTSTYHPFGLFFANPTTLYVADEGSPTAPTTNGPGTVLNSPDAGLQKWSLVAGTWKLDYVLANGLNLNVLKPVAGYTFTDGTGLTETVDSAVTGLRNLAGVVNADGTATLYAITGQTSAISGGEPDPDSLVSITDQINATTLPTSEQFSTLATSSPGSVFRGVADAPVPEPATLGLLAVGAVAMLRRRSPRRSA